LLYAHARAVVLRPQALADQETLSRQLAAAFPQTNKERVARLTDARMVPEDTLSSAKIVSGIILAILSAAPGVAYAETHGATSPVNWTEDELKKLLALHKAMSKRKYRFAAWSSSRKRSPVGRKWHAPLSG
jgi:hypothetical protein